MSIVSVQKKAAAQGAARVLAVGVSEYPVNSGFARLPVCSEDARRVAQAFREVKELNGDLAHIQFVAHHKDAKVQPTAGHIYKEIKNLASQANADERIIFYFSGHGVRLNEEFFLVPEDGESDDSTFLLSFEKVQKILAGSEAKQKIIIIDACNSGPTTTTTKTALANVSDKFLTEYMAKTKGTAVLTSSTAEQTSTTQSPDPKVSLFTYFLVKALRGEPAALDGKLLTFDSLYSYVSVNTISTSKSYGKPQHPSVKNHEYTGIPIFGDFSQPLLQAAAADLIPIIDTVEFAQRQKGSADNVLTSFKNFSKYSVDYIEKRVQDNIYEAYKDEFATTRARLFEKFGHGQVHIQDDGLTFPGGAYRVEYQATDVKTGFYTFTAEFDSDWLVRSDEMLEIIDLLEVNPTVIKFGTSTELQPENCIAKLQSAGWKIMSARDDQVKASLGVSEITIVPTGIRIRGMLPAQMFPGVTSSAEPSQALTGLIVQLAGQKLLK